MKFLLTSLTICLFFQTLAAQTTVTIESIKDNTLIENGTGSVSAGADAHVFAGRVGSNGGGAKHRSVIKFDVAAIVPSGATITAASLQLNMNKASNGSNQTVVLKKITDDWGEGTSDGNGGQGAPSTTNDATWLHRFYTTSTWATAGGDFVGTVSASASVGGVGLYVWATNAQIVADVQAWRTTPATNFGWILIGEESVQQTVKRFDSRESTTPTNRPRLTITYTAAIPVELTAFSAKTKGISAVQLDWTTASETNSRDFAVEYRSDTVDEGNPDKSGKGSNFQTICILKAAGNTHEKRFYQYEHAAPNAAGVNYYRLRQTDLDGQVTLSKVVSIAFGKGKTIGIYPNPVENTLFLEKSNDLEAMSIFDAFGRQVRNTEGSSRQIDVSDLPKGIYFLKTTTGAAQRFVKTL